jgi:hypothetical protein
MANYEAQNYIVTNGLVLNLDAGDPDSYTRSQPPYVEVLVVAGGGGGGWGEANYFGDAGGGGGAGGLIYNSAFQLTNATAITVTVGSGGAGSSYGVNGSAGSNSVFGSLTAIGGGLGCAEETNATSINNGGSGGGAGGACVTLTKIPGSGVAGQGSNGGISLDNATFYCNVRAGGGGGGAGGVGLDAAVGGVGGNGGPGQAYSISGTSTYYGGGGGGGGAAANTTGGGLGGVGGGGSGSGAFNGSIGTLRGQHGTANTGGGGGSAGSGLGTAGNGGSGIVIVRYPGLPAATGGTITYLNGYTIHTFTSSGTFTPYLWNDTSGQGIEGILNNGVGFNSYQNGGSLTFDGTDDYVVASNVYDFGTSNAMTAEVWAKSDTANWNDNGFLISRRNQFIIHPQAGTRDVYFYVHPGGYQAVYISVPSIVVYNQYVLTYNAGTLNAYLNGSLGSNASVSSPIDSYTGDTYIGKDDFLPRYLDGNIASVRLYNRALSAAEVLQNYNAQKSRFGL